VISIQQLNADALRKIAPSITTLARAEGLEAHARSIEVRLA
jgi:histidinol dehydrogenase